MNELALPTYHQIKALERAIAEELPPVDFPLKHDFIPGVYVRSMFIPAGCVLVGKLHTTEHVCILAKGHVLVVSEEGGRKDLRAGEVFVSQPGAKRVIFALEDSVFINVHTNTDDEKDLDVLEAKFITPEQLGYDKPEAIE